MPSNAKCSIFRGENFDTPAKRGGATSCGSLMTAPGGGGATGDSEGVGGKDLDVFEALDTLTGRGGAPNSSGTKGRVWLRVAI